MAKEKKYTVTSPPIHMEEEMRDAVKKSAKKHGNSQQEEYRELIAIGLKTKKK
jgi:plasmid stability protein